MVEPNYERVACVLCGNGAPKPVFRHWQMNSWVYVSICPNDGLVFLNPRWTRERYARFYATEYDSVWRSDETGADFQDEDKYGKAKTMLERIARHRAIEFRSALDVGAGMGWTLQHLMREMPGIRAAAIEMSRGCGDHIRNEVGAELISDDVDADWHLANAGQFDLVSARHVVEHFMNPVDALRKVRDVLSGAGVAYIAVPDIMNPSGSKNREFRLAHTYFFNTGTLAMAAVQAGLRPLVVEGGDEVWGLFSKETGTPSALPNTFDRQMSVLRAYQRREMPRDLFFNLPKRLFPGVKRMIPASLRDRLRGG